MLTLPGRKPQNNVNVLADYAMRLNAQGLEIARLSREVASIRGLLAQIIESRTVATNGPVPASTADAKSGRSLMRLIATRLGKNEDTVRGVLVTSAYFARVRAASMTAGMPITRNMEFLAYLADNLDTAWPA